MAKVFVPRCHPV